MLTADQIQALATELAGDAYTALAAAGNHLQLQVMLNAVSDQIPITPTSMTRDEFLTAALPGVLAIGSLEASLQAKWDRLLSIVRAATVIIRPVVTPMLAMAVADGVLTQTQADGFGVRPGSRAEQLFGPGVLVDLSDVSLSLREAK